MTFPDGSTADAYSRLVPLGGGRCVCTFTLAALGGKAAREKGTLGRAGNLFTALSFGCGGSCES